MRQHRIKKDSDMMPSSVSMEIESEPPVSQSTTYLQVPKLSHGGRIEKQSSEPPIPTQMSFEEPYRISPTSSHYLLVPGSNIPPPGPLQKQRSQPLLPSQQTSITLQHYTPTTSSMLQRQLSQPSAFQISQTHSPPIISAHPAFQINQGAGKPPVQVHYLQAAPTSKNLKLSESPSIVIEQYHPIVQLLPADQTVPIKHEPGTSTATCITTASAAPVSTSPVISEIPPKLRLVPLRPKEETGKMSPQVSFETTTSCDPQRLVHCPVLRPGPALGCNFCWNTVDNHGRILRRKTKYCCPECQTNLCIVPCFQLYHQKFEKEGVPKTKSNSNTASGSTNTDKY